MHIISQSTLRKFWTIHPQSKVGLRQWYKLANNHKWQNINDIRKIFPSADIVGNFIIFNISGNNYRLITYIDFQKSKVFIREILTHAEYDKNKWKKDDWYKK
ncbi:MAG: type II toxin-antitoxin system HigB family toxin [Crocosphaera sp.]|nr:type II toxin-antitoxin system HigB family toxin [Crocosphaera sp.]